MSIEVLPTDASENTAPVPTTELLPATELSPATSPQTLLSIAEALHENSGGMLRTPDFPRIKIPGGGCLAWMIPVEGEEQPIVCTSFQAIILAHDPIKLFYKSSFDSATGGEPPVCWSNDGLIGRGVPGGSCAACPNNKFGSAVKDGRPQPGKACQDRRRLLLLINPALVKTEFPYLLFVSPGSLGEWQQYLHRQISGKNLRYWRVVTEFRLIQKKSKLGITYSALLPRLVAPLSAEWMAKIDTVHDLWLRMLHAMDSSSILSDDIDEENGVSSNLQNTASDADIPF